MGVRTALTRIAAGLPPLMVLERPGGWRARAAVEQVARERGWPVVAAPASASVLVVCGPADDELEETVETVWAAMPWPRARCEVVGPGTGADAVRQALDDAAAQVASAELALPESPRSDRLPIGTDMGHGDMGHGDMGHGDMGHGDMGHGDMGHGDMGHGDMGHGDMGHGDMGHGDMDHSDMDMAPGGVPLAEGGEDRDGLEMDVLHVPLGPVLAHWPAGIVISCALQGDLVVAAQTIVVARDTDQEPLSAAASAARWCDHAAQLLGLCGPPTLARRAAVVRGGLLADAEANGYVSPDSLSRLSALGDQVASSWLLRWALRGVGRRHDTGAPGVPDRWSGDALDRLLWMLRTAVDTARGTASSTPQVVDPARVGDYLEGLELAAARLVVASLALDAGQMVVPADA